MEQLTGSGLRKEYIGVYCHCLFNLYSEHIMQNARLDELQAEIKIARRNINKLRYADDTRKLRGTKEPIDECEGGE